MCSRRAPRPSRAAVEELRGRPSQSGLLRHVRREHAEHEQRRERRRRARRSCMRARRAGAGTATGYVLPVELRPRRRLDRVPRERRARQTCAAVEEADRDQVERVEQEPDVREREEQVGVVRLADDPARPRAPTPPRTGPASETSALRHGFSRASLDRHVRAEERDERRPRHVAAPGAAPRRSGRARARRSSARSRARTSSPRSARSRRRR